MPSPAADTTSKEGETKTLTIDVRSPVDAMADFTRTWNAGKPQQPSRISFAAPEWLWKALTGKRWETLKALRGAGPRSIREAARRFGREVNDLHGDGTVPLNTGVLVRMEDGRIVFPFEAVKVEFPLRAA